MTIELERVSIGGVWQYQAATEGGGGGSQPPIPFVQNTDPGAVGAGALWVDTSGDPPVVYVRNTADDGWLEQGATPNLAAVLAIGDDADGHDLTNIANIVLDGSGTIDMAGGGFDTSGGGIATGGGNISSDGGDIASGVGGKILTESIEKRPGYANALNVAASANALGFFGEVGSTQAELARPSGDAGDLWDILNAYGLVVAP